MGIENSFWGGDNASLAEAGGGNKAKEAEREFSPEIKTGPEIDPTDLFLKKIKDRSVVSILDIDPEQLPALRQGAKILASDVNKLHNLKVDLPPIERSKVDTLVNQLLRDAELAEKRNIA